MIRRVLWVCAGLIATCVLVLIAFNWAAMSRETVAFGNDVPADGRFLETDEGAIFIVEKGAPNGQRLLFSHGTAAWSDIWAETLENTGSEGYLATAFDMPPFGWSEHPQTPDYSRTMQANRVIALLEALGDKPVMVAHSVSAGPVSEALMRRPDLVSGYVIVSGALGLADRDSPKDPPVILQNHTIRTFLTSATATNPLLTKHFLRGFMHRKDMVDPAMVQSLQRPMIRQGYTNAVSDWVPQLFTTPKDALSMDPDNWGKFDLPVALIWGDQDTVTPLEQGQDIAAMLPNARLNVLKDVGHIPHLEAPEAFAAALLGVLDEMNAMQTEDRGKQ